MTIDVIRRESTVFGTVVFEREGDEDKIAEQNRRDGVVSRNNLLLLFFGVRKLVLPTRTTMLKDVIDVMMQ